MKKLFITAIAGLFTLVATNAQTVLDINTETGSRIKGDQGGSIELKGNGSQTPYIDLSTNPEDDYHGRIIIDENKNMLMQTRWNAGQIFLNKNGNVGIGTTTPVEKFQIGSEFTFHDGGTKILGRNFDYTSQAQRIVYGTASTISFNGSGDIQLRTAPTGNGGEAINWSTDGFILKNDGDAGLGTFSPTANLHIHEPNFNSTVKSMTPSSISNIKLTNVNNNLGLELISNNDNAFIVNHKQGSLTLQSGTKSLRINNDGVTTSTFKATNIETDNLALDKLEINSSSDAVAIQVKSGATPKFQVKANGEVKTQNTIFCNGLEVQLDIDFPDYVFEDSYDLKSIEEVEEFIEENGHLPNVPSAKTVETEGMNVAEMNVILVEKVEEMMLYIIEQNKRIAELEDKLK